MRDDNWTTCPQCNADELARRDAAKRKAAESYGKVPAEQYLEMLRESEAESKPEQTLREDYSIGMGEDGVFIVDYRCVCTKCRRQWRYAYATTPNLTKKEGAK